MVASTDIKFFVHTNNNAPQLQNAYGSMINVLDACLVNGINIGAISSFTVSEKTVTALFSSAHNLVQYQVIKITGANQAEFNGEHRILTVPNAQSVTFELTSTPSVSTATGTIIASLPPLGFELPFQDVGKRAYRSRVAGSPFIRVVDSLDPVWSVSYAKFAKVGLVEDMTDINTLLGAQTPYDPAMPNKNWDSTGSGISAFNGWAKWFYATNNAANGTSNKLNTPTDGVRQWFLVGDSENFYIFNATTPTTNLEAYIAQGYGKLKSLSKINASPYFLAAAEDYTAASGTIYTAKSALTLVGNNAPAFMLRDYQNTAQSTKVYSRVMARDSSASSGVLSVFPNPNSNIAVLSSDYLIVEGTSSLIPRGMVPLLKWLYQAKPYSHLQTFQQDGRMNLAISCVSDISLGQILVDLGGIYGS